MNSWITNATFDSQHFTYVYVELENIIKIKH